MRRSPLAPARGPLRTEPFVVGVLAVLVALLAAFGVLALRQGPQDPSADGPAAAPSGPEEAAAVPDDVLALLPHREEELRAGALVAAEFVAAYATTDPEESPAERMERLGAGLSDGFAARLEQALAAPAAERGPEGAVRAEAAVRGIRSVGETSVVFLVSAAEAGGGEPIQEYAATVAREEDRWLVYDVQFADAGDSGDGGDGAL
ncbi:hypothetical protein J0910_18905 [Nocardiopsis sp. CNT-189]|uniref:hypothetical protein n=1 Tax=Nocardiopsis oceanisediminis TaxID=2816862 RepID=UPI003B2C0D33